MKKVRENSESKRLMIRMFMMNIIMMMMEMRYLVKHLYKFKAYCLEAGV